MTALLKPASEINILIVDDTADNLRLLATILELQGYNVRKSLSGKMALQGVNYYHPDLILLDINMPDMNGYEVCQQLKASEATSDIPVIFISAIERLESKIQAFELGGMDYITKPFQEQEVLIRVKNQLLIRQQRQQLIEQNKCLEQEISKRLKAENELRRLNDSLHLTVLERNDFLQEVNRELISQIVKLGQVKTERQQTEHQLELSLQEKDVLLKEIHHRVKNNLQIISSLLKLQSDSIRDGEALTAFANSYNRVRAMALLHENIYRFQNLSAINAPSYIKSLVVDLCKFYSANLNQIDLKLEVAEIALDIDTAIPCALIISELISNSLKYAFPSPGQGEIKIQMYDDPERWFLVVSDNGVGLPPELDLEEVESLGLGLVNILIQQLSGSLEVDVGQGTCFKFSFNRNDNFNELNRVPSQIPST